MLGLVTDPPHDEEDQSCYQLLEEKTQEKTQEK